MERSRWAVLGVWALLLALAGAPQEVRGAREAVYNLWVLDGGAMAVICTGTAISTDEGPAFLTAGHCVADARDDSPL